ncbi:hypothetical protein [Streptomyces sp. WMMB 322]|uniref:hypothetical protein n=1 Tax=Streptomyces sp. WMMB 322 TaxID=1286821 RepID=UPI0006E218B7|nr:hypothetical protein [Streptomyces sp. WMMB 322]SCK10521.1 hypothetical protein H180DRAFT_00585 [Streptomyces sp. WMMB 322]
MRVRRALGVAVVVPVLAVTAVACSGGGDEGGGAAKKEDNRGRQSGGSGGGGAEEGGDGAGSGVPPLDEKQLNEALLKTGDVKGYRAQRNKEDALEGQGSIESEDPRCSPITDVVDSQPEREREAFASGVLMKGSLSTGGAVQQVLLSSYGDGGAVKWFGDLKKALSECGSFAGKIGTGERTQLRIKRVGSVGVGDDSVRFTMEDVKGKDSPTVFTIVRTGGNTASFMSVSLSDEPQAVAKSLVKKQHEKLTEAAGD